MYALNLSFTENKNPKTFPKQKNNKTSQDLMKSFAKRCGRHNEGRKKHLGICRLYEYFSAYWRHFFCKAPQKPLPPHYKRAEEIIIFHRMALTEVPGSSFVRFLCKHPETHVLTLSGYFYLVG